MIGKLGRMIKSKKHPVATLAKRYQLNIAAVAHAPTDAMEEDEGDPSDVHPLLSTGALNSYVDASKVIWPKLTRWNSERQPINSRQDHARTRVLEPILGKDECDQHINEPTTFELVHVHTRVQVGIYNYNSKRNEERRKTEKARDSWFRILAKDVPLLVRDAPRTTIGCRTPGCTDESYTSLS